MSANLYKEGVLPSLLLEEALRQIRAMEAFLEENELSSDKRLEVELCLAQARINYTSLTNLALGQRPFNDPIQ